MMSTWETVGERVLLAGASFSNNAVEDFTIKTLWVQTQVWRLFGILGVLRQKDHLKSLFNWKWDKEECVTQNKPQILLVTTAFFNIFNPR